MKKLVVSQNNDGDYLKIQDAIDALSCHGGEIYIKDGTYKEKIHIFTENITLVGDNNTILTFDDYAYKMWNETEQYGTFRSYTIYIGANNFIAENIRFINNAGIGTEVGQTIAVYTDADKLAFYNCSFESNQDTLFISPLPPAPIIKDSFKGCGKKDPNLVHRNYFENCFIKGDIDFIFGGGIAYFNNCTIFSNNRNENINGYITAASTPKDQKYGFVFKNCNLISDCAANTVYLGRPWRIYAKTVFISCDMGEHIHACGWHNWNKPESELTTYYAEYTNSDLSQRVSWSKSLNSDNLYTVQNVLSGNDAWNPERITTIV